AVANDLTCDTQPNGACTGAGPVTFDQFGGTSLSAPLFAGLPKVIEQKKGAGLGLINILLYQLAKAGLAANGIRDVNNGTNNGFNGVAGFAAGGGYPRHTRRGPGGNHQI